MGAEFKVYDLNRVSLIFGGIPISGGFADGEVIEIDQEDPDFTVKKGADGSVTRSKTNQRFTKVTVKLLQSSGGNTALSLLNNIDRGADNGASVVPLLIADLGGLTIFAAEHSWIAKPPKASFGAEATPREWEIHVADPTRLDGGN